jgi:hypothetical protein
MRNAKLILFLFLVVAFLPYLYTCFYALPFADDFCFGWTASENISFARKFLCQYLYWNGRYTSDVLVNLHPLTTGSLFLYQLVSFIFILATPAVFFAFIKPWIDDKIAAIIAALFISLFYLCYQPNITEGVYWYIGLVNYHAGNLCFILQLALLNYLLKNDKNRIVPFVISLLLLIVSIGFNEVGAAIIPAYYLLALICIKANSITAKAIPVTSRIVAIHLFVAIAASAFVIFSPGNFTRQSNFHDSFHLFHSLYFASLQTIRFVGKWSLSVPFVALSLTIMVHADKIRSDIIKKTAWWVLLILLLFTVFMGAFLPYMATGILGQHRTMNYVFPFFIILWIATLISLSEKYRLPEKLRLVITGSRAFVLAVLSVVIMSCSANAGKILADIKSGSFQSYKSEFMERQATIIDQPSAPIISLKQIPKTFMVVDAQSDTTWWVDKCMKKFYTETGIVLR